MRAVTWQGRRDVRVDEVPDPTLRGAGEIIVKVTTTGLCGSDLHLYEVLGPFMTPGDVLGHETMGVVVEKSPDVTGVDLGDRVVAPFQIACGHCFMCERGLQTQCEVTQVREEGMGAALFGYSRLYGSVPGGQAEYLRVPHADYGPIVVSGDLPDERYVYLSDVMPTAWQAVRYAGVGADQTLAIVGLGPIGDMAARLATREGIRVIGFDRVPERLARLRDRGIEVADIDRVDPVDVVQAATDGRGADGVIDAVGMEAHGSGIAETAQKLVGHLPAPLARAAMTRVSVDRMGALNLSLSLVRRGGTVSLSGVYAGTMDPMSLQSMFDRQLTVRMGQANVRRWVDDLLPLTEDSADPLGLASFATHHLDLAQAPHAYDIFQRKAEGAVKVLFHPFGQ
ncbi:glutathione-dependent formaldehyde dehydrogenase [Aeromicrobium sp. PE09-221]|uniref:alcohol dehydrogenase catalytic domain-containing protein n=1 Tax=Aeromicrobium sp. PE09-221 TaxID=1898043 RepID=UPI000B3E9C2E|nr:alcohol dehydrogenase catalytic domain-containing protein [Aeromicrobium sp. PE09-221]OUZ09956.1 glutathione-dependent formaldehyde dehydrogenase [Aeromicrobium sp. PE09-221]